MPTYLGDFPTGQTIYIPFHTFSSDDPSASMTITGLALADIKIYKDGGTTQRSSTAGFTLLDTDGIDFDAITGIHGISIDTSDNTDAGFYAKGSDYWVVIDSVTLDSGTISFVAAIFSIDNRGLLRPTTAQRTLDVTATGAAGIDWGNIENKTTANDFSATDIQLCDTVTTLTGHTAQTGDTFAQLPTNFVDLSITNTAGRVDVAKWLGSSVTVGNGSPNVNIKSTDDIDLSATQKASVNTEVDNALDTAIPSPTADSINDVLNNQRLGVVSSTCAAGSTTTTVETNLTEATDDHYNGRIVVFTSGALLGQASNITDYNGTSKALTVTALTESPANTDSFLIV